MKIKNTDRCKCGHCCFEHEIRNIESKNLRTICWECASMSSSLDIFNLDAYHEFRLENLEYLQKLYEDKQKGK